MATITDILISELDRARIPATGADELVINQIEPNSKEFVTRRISWQEVGYSIQDLAGDSNFPGVQQIYFDDGLEIEPSITFKNDVETGIYRPIISVPAIGITVNAAEALRCVASSTSRHTGFNFANNDPSVPIDVVHVKKGGVYIQLGDVLGKNDIHLTSDLGEPLINTPGVNALRFGTQDKERGRFTEQGNFHIYGALGVGDYAPMYYHGADGDLLLSRGNDKSPKWTPPGEFILNNSDIIIDLLLDSDEFIQNIINALLDVIGIEIINEELDKLNIGPGLDVDTRDNGTGTGTDEFYLYNTFVFDHLVDITTI